MNIFQCGQRMKINFDKIPEFEKDLKKQKRKYPSLDDDLVLLEKAINADFPETPRGTVRISGLGNSVRVPLFKVRKFRCKSKGNGTNSGIRVIYAYIEDSNMILFVEIYRKSQNLNEDKKRIYTNFKE